MSITNVLKAKLYMVYCVVDSDYLQADSTNLDSTKRSTVDDAVTRYLPYLQEIQKKLLTLLIVTVVSGLLGFFFYQKIIAFILGIFNLSGVTIILSSPYQFIELSVNTGIATGMIIAFPLFIYYLVGFLKPALAPKEYKLLLSLIPFALLLFVIGFSFGAWVMQFVINMYTQTAIDFNVTNMWDISHFFAQTIIMGLCLGFMFELPIVMTLLIKLKLIKKESIANKRRFVYAAIVIIAALLPPSDVISLSILTLVPTFLFELALLLNKAII